MFVFVWMWICVGSDFVAHCGIKSPKAQRAMLFYASLLFHLCQISCSHAVYADGREGGSRKREACGVKRPSFGTRRVKLMEEMIFGFFFKATVIYSSSINLWIVKERNAYIYVFRKLFANARDCKIQFPYMRCIDRHFEGFITNAFRTLTQLLTGFAAMTWVNEWHMVFFSVFNLLSPCSFF